MRLGTEQSRDLRMIRINPGSFIMYRKLFVILQLPFVLPFQKGLFAVKAEGYTDFSQLTTPMINEFVDKILVHAPEKIDGERTMKIEIYLKFIGKFDIPMPEPTPEELTAEEKARKKRAAERAKYERRKERKRQQKLEAEQQAQTTERADVPEDQTA